MAKALEFFLSSRHWLEGLTQPLDQHMERLVIGLRELVGEPGDMHVVPTPPEKAAPTREGTPHPSATRRGLEGYLMGMRHEINNNLVLELYDKPDHGDICIPHLFRRVPEDDASVAFGLAEILRLSPKVGLVGEAGSGKTTTLRMACLDLTSDPEALEYLPIYLPLASFGASSAGGFADFIDSELATFGCSGLEELEQHGLPLILFLDGWDEVASDQARDVIKRFLARSAFRFVLTSRPEAQRSLPLCDRFQIAPLDFVRMRQLMGKRLIRRSALEKFMQWLGGDATLLRLGENPLNLSLMGIAFTDQGGEGGHLTRTRLYDQAFDAILRQQHRAMSEVGLVGNSPFEVRAVGQALERVAYDVAVAGKGRFFSRRELERSVVFELGEGSAGILDVLVGHLGVLRDRRAGRIEFFHLWYQEFLAARYVIANRDSTGEILHEFENPRLSTSLPYAVGLLAGSREAFELLTDLEVGDAFTHCQAIAEGQFQPVEVAQLLEQVLWRAESAVPQTPVRIELGPALAAAGECARTPLQGILRDSQRSDYVRRACLEGLARLSNHQDFDASLVGLIRETEGGLLWHLIEHVGHRRVAEARDLLIDLIRSQDPIAAGDATWALWQLDGGELVPDEEVFQLVLRCLASPDRHLQGHAIRTLGRLGSPLALDALKGHLEGESNAYRWIVPEAAAMIGGRKALDLLEVALSDPTVPVVAAALKGLRSLNEVPVERIPPLLDEIEGLIDDSTWLGSEGLTLGELARDAHASLASRR